MSPSRKKFFPKVAFYRSLGLQISSKLITGQQVAALNWLHTGGPMRILFARWLFLYVAYYVYSWQGTPSHLRQSRGDPPLIKAVTKTWRKTGAHVLIRFKARGLVKTLNLVAIIHLKGKKIRKKKRACRMRIRLWFPASMTTKCPACSWSPAGFPMGWCVGLERHMDSAHKSA